jgi:hypothetical protein
MTIVAIDQQNDAAKLIINAASVSGRSDLSAGERYFSLPF